MGRLKVRLRVKVKIAVIQPNNEQTEKWLLEHIDQFNGLKVIKGIIVLETMLSKVTKEMSALKLDYKVYPDPEKEYIVRLSPNATVKVVACTPEYARILAWDMIDDGFTYKWDKLDFLNDAEVSEVPNE